MHRHIAYALLAAVLFGTSTPLSKLLLADMHPQLLGGLLYLGSGLGLAVVRLARDRNWQPANLTLSEWCWFLGAIAFGGVLGPVALFWGLGSTPAATASLLLNLEAVLTAALAWLCFRENADRRVVAGMAAIVAGSVALSWPQAGSPVAMGTGVFAVALACLCWAIDNNLTRKVSASDALFIASTKGLVAGSVNTGLALTWGAALPSLSITGAAMALGLFGYGVSLVLFVLALRNLGTARTGAYFSVAPFAGAALALALGESATPLFWLATALMALGVWLHLTERHDHEHQHEAMGHTHPHTHDAHHQHKHAFDWDAEQPHSHWHEHAPLRHRHAHFPDIHHRHGH